MMECVVETKESSGTTTTTTEMETKKKKKKKNRGTRRQQRYRAKQKLLELCELASAAAVAQQTVSKQDDIDIQTIKKRKRELMTTPTISVTDHVIQSFSQLSIEPSCLQLQKQKKLRTSKYCSSKQQEQQQPQIHNIKQKKIKKDKENKVERKKHVSISLPDYLNVPNRIFKKMFIEASQYVMSIAQNDAISKWLNIHINMQYIREYACLLDKLLYLQLQQSLWTEYFQIGITENVWASEVQEKITRQTMNDSTLISSSISSSSTPLSFVTQYRKNNDEQIQKTENELNKYLNSFKCIMGHKSSPVQSIELSAMLKAFVRKGQHKLNAEFQCKKRLLQFDCQDHELTKAFFDLKPTKQQIHVARKIWSATFKQQIAEEQIVMLKHRLFSKTLPKTFDLLDRPFNDLDQNLQRQKNVIDKNIRAIITSRRNKVIGQLKLDVMAIYISTAEATARAHAKRAKEIKDKFLSLKFVQQDVNGLIIRNNLMNTIEARQENIIKRAQYVTGSSKIQHINNLLPSSAIVEVATSFTNKHLFILAYGPKYVLKCQSHFTSSSSSIENIIEREYKMMSPIIMNCLTDNCVSASDERAKIFFISLKNLLRDLYTTKLPSSLFHHARQEYFLMKQIQHKLHSTCKHIILRRTDKSKVFHLGSMNDYQQKAIMYMTKTCAYEEVKDGKCPLAYNLSLVTNLLDKLLKNKLINSKQYSTMIPNKDKVELGHLYFLPKPHKIGTPLRPIISSMNGPTIAVSHFLDLLLRPLFDHVAKQTTFVNGIDVVRQLEKYRDNGYLLSSTQFVTFDVTDLYTMIPRNGALEALGRFLIQNSMKGKISNLSVDTILKLARLVLDTNYFIYDNKYYRQIKGGAMGSPFTMTLANVYMLEWEQSLIELQLNQEELYGRYIDDVFMTSNMPVGAIHTLLDFMNKKDEKHIQITYSIGLKVEFLDVHIENSNGSLITSIFHKPAAEPYILPYGSDHTRHIHINIPYQALLRAVRLCSNVYVFDKERLDIEMILLLNGYPPKFIKRHFDRFFRLNQAIEVFTELDEKKYENLHQKLLYLPTRREKKKYQQNRKINNENQIGNEQQWNKKILMLPYTFESGPLMNFKREFRKLWTKYYVYKGSVMNDVRLVITTHSNPSLNDLLVHKKPSRSLLTKLESLSLEEEKEDHHDDYEQEL